MCLILAKYFSFHITSFFTATLLDWFRHKGRTQYFNELYQEILILIVLGFNDMSPLVGHFMSSSRKGIEEEIKESDRGGRGK